MNAKNRKSAILVWLLFVSFTSLNGEAQTQPFRGHVDLLCQLTQCSQPQPRPLPTGEPAPPPASLMLTVLAVSGPITPGGKVLIKGFGFGNTPGMLSLTGPQPLGLRHLEVTWWNDTLVEATIPREIGGVPDMQASLYLVKADGQEDILWSVDFTATRETLPLPRGAVQVTRCKDADWRNRCNPHIYQSKEYSIYGDHWGWFFGSSGTDLYSISLRNGWLLSDKTMYWLGGHAPSLRGWTPGVPSVTLAVDWSYGSQMLDEKPAVYGIQILVVGPRGVPYQ